LGGGAVFFWVMQNCKIEKAYLNELNPDIYLCYVAIQKDVESVIKHLKNLENKYHKLNDEDQSDFYYQVRSEYNENRKTIKSDQLNPKEILTRVAMTIFLNRTCFNGLYRLNASGGFNVPFGRYKNPLICNKENLLAISELLQKAVITNEDFAVVKKHIKPDSFVYFDPPYRPLNKTSNFTSYMANVFDDKEQERLAGLVKALSNKGRIKIMLSNSDPKNENPSDDFFDKLYDGFNLVRIKARRLINCNVSKRSHINEIIVTNY
jgi:DNA adenine methylase